MRSYLPRKYTLEDLLAGDPLALMSAEYTKAYKAFVAAHPEGAKETASTYEHLRKIYKEQPGLREILEAIDGDTEEDLLKISQLISISVEQLVRVETYQKEHQAAVDRVASADELIRSWRALKQQAGIADIGEENFPETVERPMLVLYSADWCDPCRWLRPTFARLVRFYDKAEVRYCHEDEWRRSRGVNFIPQLVAYFPNGASVSSDCPRTTRELWETMNKLVALGESWSGEGELVCDQYSSAIVPKRTR